MKKTLQTIAVIFAAVMMINFGACKQNSDSHEHTFSTEWTKDSTHHWHAATCEHTSEIRDKAEHTFVLESTTATMFDSGTMIFKCACGESKTLNIGPLYSVPSNAQGVPLNAVPEDKIVYFGIFPRTIVKQNGTTLYGKDGTTVITIAETTANSKTIGANTYYKGSDGEYYQKATEYLNEYNDKTTYAYMTAYNHGDITNNDSLTYSDGTEVRKTDENNTYTRWFRVEPIKWKVLTSDFNIDYTNVAATQKACLLLAEEIVYSNVPYFESENRNPLRPNSYKDSQIRAYLNGISYAASSTANNNIWVNKGFLQTAFTTNAQALIKTTKVNNSAETTSYSLEQYSLAYSCEPTNDKIFLLSQSEVILPNLGFPAYNAKGVGNARIRKATDYARANNCYQSTTPGYGGCWWLRSPTATIANTLACGIHHHGEAENCNNYVNRKNGGIVPALAITIPAN